jgi:hypothetical protein
MPPATATPVAPSDKLGFDISLTDEQARELFLQAVLSFSTLPGNSHASIIQGAVQRGAMLLEAIRSLS